MSALTVRKRASAASEYGFSIVNDFILILFTLICLYPFYYIFIYSISDPIQAQGGLTLLPKGFSLFTYIQIFKLNGMLNATVISVMRTVIGTILTVFCCSLFAYLMTNEKFPGRKFFYRFLIITMYFNAGLIPWYLVMKFLHLNNNFLLYILPSSVVAFYVILAKTYIEQLPRSLEDSAKIDGARCFTIYSKIIFPICVPIIATIAVFAAVGQWNTWFDNFFLVSDKRLNVLQLMLYNYLSTASSIAQASAMDINRGSFVKRLTPESVRMTITMAVTLPIIFAYPFMQKYFIKGIMLGAIKG